MTPHRVLLVEDKVATATFIAQQLAEGGLMAETVPGGLEALRRAHAHTFALALVDVDLASEPDGLVTADWLHRLYGVAVVVYAMRSVDESQPVVSLAGPAGVVESGSGASALVATLLRAVSPRRSWNEFIADAKSLRHPPTHAASGRSDRGGRAGERPHLPEGFAHLTAREWQIIHDLIEAPTVRAVAERHHRSPHTVHNHVKSIFKKLQVHSVAELLSLMVRLSRSAVSL